MQGTRESAGIQWRDTPDRYGAISRFLHWSMAVLILWQFLMMILFDIFGPLEALQAVARFGPHGIVGAAVLVLVLIRGAWALFNVRRRPPQAPGHLGRIARAGHLGFYALMLVIPAVALLRVYGSGRGWRPYDVQLIPTTGEEIAWMVAPGDAVHGLLSWVLLALVGGHVAMALAHHLFWKDATLQRMAGSPRP